MSAANCSSDDGHARPYQSRYGYKWRKKHISDQVHSKFCFNFDQTFTAETTFYERY